MYTDTYVYLYEPIDQPQDHDPCTRTFVEDSIPPDSVGDGTTAHIMHTSQNVVFGSIRQWLKRSLRAVAKHSTRPIGNNRASGLSAGQSLAASLHLGLMDVRDADMHSKTLRVRTMHGAFFFFFSLSFFGQVRLGVRKTEYSVQCPESVRVQQERNTLSCHAAQSYRKSEVRQQKCD